MFSEVSVIFVRWMHTFMVDEMEGYIKDNIWHLQSLSTDTQLTQARFKLAPSGTRSVAMPAL